MYVYKVDPNKFHNGIDFQNVQNILRPLNPGGVGNRFFLSSRIKDYIE